MVKRLSENLVRSLQFGPQEVMEMTAEVSLTNPAEGCDSITTDLTNKIAFIQRSRTKPHICINGIERVLVLLGYSYSAMRWARGRTPNKIKFLEVV